MSVATEITRLTTAKANIKTAIENKGVIVPAATKLDGYSSLIASIPTGGGGSGNGLPIGCPRIDLVQLDANVDSCLLVMDARLIDSFRVDAWATNTTKSYVAEVSISTTGDVTELRRSSQTYITLDGGGFVCVLLKSKGPDITSCNIYPTTPEDTVPIVAVKSNCSSINTRIGLYYNSFSNRTNTESLVPDGYGSSIYYDSSNFNINLKSINTNNECTIYRKLRGACDGTAGAIKLLSMYNNTRYKAEVDLSLCDFSNSVASNFNWSTFYLCQSVYKLTMPSDSDKGFRFSLNMSSCTGILVDSWVSVLNSLYDHISHATGSTPTLTIGTANLNKLSEAQKAIATDKGWTLA